MKPRYLTQLVGTILVASQSAFAAPILFPDGSFEDGTLLTVSSPLLGGTETGTASNWDVSVSGLLGLINSVGTIDDGESTIARIIFAPGVGGSATLEAEVTPEFEPNSDYIVSLNLRSDSLPILGPAGLAVDVLDGNGNVVTSFVDNQILGLLDPLVDEFQTIQLPFSTSDTPPDGPLSLRIGANSLSLLGYTLDVDDIGLDVESNDGGTPGGGTGVTRAGNRPPSIAVRGKSRFKTNRERVVIRGRARDDSRVINVQYQFRGKPKSRAIRVAKGTNNWRFRLRLQEGKNVVRVRALDNDGTKSRWKKIVVTRTED